VQDVAVIGTLVLLEGLLSADNALVLALLVKHLPEEERKKALLYGLGGAVALRGVGILLAKKIVGLWWLAAIGAGYLLYLCVKHFVGKRRGEIEDLEEAKKKVRPGMGFWQTVAVVELTDVAFAIDSILVAVAFADKLWVIYTGAFIGIVLLRIAAGFFVKLIERYPTLDNMAYALVGWAGVKLSAKALQLFWVNSGRYTPDSVPHLLPDWLFWSVMALIVAVGVWTARKGAQRDGPAHGAAVEAAIEAEKDNLT
jgi:YkoY family integral membrane protein